MSSSLQFNGSLILGPPSAGDCGFSDGTFSQSFGFTEPAAVSAQHTKNVNSPSAFVALDGIGVTVTQATFFFLKTTSVFIVRITYKPLSGPDVVSTIPVMGPMLVKTPVDQYIKLVEVQGTGAVSYLATGNQ
jgi:hypothetical protein